LIRESFDCRFGIARITAVRATAAAGTATAREGDQQREGETGERRAAVW
jgi:hypothetical protein